MVCPPLRPLLQEGGYRLSPPWFPMPCVRELNHPPPLPALVGIMMAVVCGRLVAVASVTLGAALARPAKAVGRPGRPPPGG